MRSEAVKVYPGGREVIDLSKVAGKREYKDRTLAMAGRQKNACAICGWFMEDPQFDHALGRGMGGAKRDDRIMINGEWNNAAVDERCNVAKGSRPFAWVDGKYVAIERMKEAA